MIQEDYVSFGVAKLLKEKGFEGKCHNSMQETTTHYSDEWNSSFTETTDIPTLQMAMKWLREKHKLYCDIKIADGDFVIDIISLKDGEFGCEAAEPESCVYPTYEQACEAGIKYCLEKLI